MTTPAGGDNSHGGNGAWPVEDQWLKSFLEDPKKNLLPCGALPLLDHKWWELTSVACDGIDEPFLSEHFAAMALWLHLNPSRQPDTPRGWKRFVSHWLNVEAKKRRWFADSRVSQQYRRDYRDR